MRVLAVEDGIEVAPFLRKRLKEEFRSADAARDAPDGGADG